jgi:hypothetical protein
MKRLLPVLLIACGGGDKPAATTPVAAGPAATEAADFVAPEKMDEINRSLERKRPIMSHCLAIAVDNKELPKSSAGRVTLEIVIAPSGKASTVKIVKASLESKTLADCIVKHVEEIQFPELPKPYETSYTYGFEAM